MAILHMQHFLSSLFLGITNICQRRKNMPVFLRAFLRNAIYEHLQSYTVHVVHVHVYCPLLPAVMSKEYVKCDTVHDNTISEYSDRHLPRNCTLIAVLYLRMRPALCRLSRVSAESCVFVCFTYFTGTGYMQRTRAPPPAAHHHQNVFESVECV